MTDRRLTPDPALITEKTTARIATPVCDLRRSPAGPRDRQLLFGEIVTVLNTTDGWTYVQADKDGYCGFVQTTAISAADAATHRVSAPATHVYAEAKIKSRDQTSLSFGSLLCVTATTGNFAETSAGFVPLTHLAPQGTYASDPVAVAALFRGTPYLWGGNSRWGIDCSGLVQAALLACGIPCPADSDIQSAIGKPAVGPYQRNDLIFWKGHVAIVSDPDTILHANGHSMSVAYEPLTAAINRIAAQGEGSVTAHRRF